MLAGDVRFEGFAATDWTRMLSLLHPHVAATDPRDPSEPRGGVVAVHERGVLRKLVHTELGALCLRDAALSFPCSAEVLAKRHRAKYSAVLETGTLEAIMDRFAERTRHDHDVVVQALTLLGAIREEV
jgi:hypothetical protein